MENIIEEVEHSLAVEHMTMTDEEKENLHKVGRSEMTYRDLVNQYVMTAKQLAAVHAWEDLRLRIRQQRPICLCRYESATQQTGST